MPAISKTRCLTIARAAVFTLAAFALSLGFSAAASSLFPEGTASVVSLLAGFVIGSAAALLFLITEV